MGGDLRDSGPKIYQIRDAETLRPSSNKPANGGLLCSIEVKISRDWTWWLGRQDSNLGMAESKSAALPLGYAPIGTGEPHTRRFGCGGGTIPTRIAPINVHRLIYICTESVR